MTTSFALMSVTSLQLLAQIGFQLLVLAALGLGRDSDAFVAAQAVPAVLVSVLGVSLQNVWQARLAVAAEASGAWRAGLRTAHAQALIAMSLACSALWASSAWWVPLLYAGLEGPTERLVLQMTPPLLLACMFSGASAVLITAQRGRDRLVSAETAGLVATLTCMVVVAPAVQAWGVVAAVYLLLARAALVWLVLLWLVGPAWPDWRAGWNDRPGWLQLRPLLAGSALYKASPLVDRYWSANASAGSLTLFSLAQTGMAALTAVLERSICMPVAPRISRCIAEGDAAGARRLYRRAVGVVAVASAAVAVGLLAAQPWWASSLAALLQMPATRADELWLLCMLLLGYMFVGAAGTAVVAVFYALGDTRTPAWIGVVGFFVGVAAKSLAFLAFGIAGLALAASLYYLANLAALVLSVERRLGSLAPHPPQR